MAEKQPEPLVEKKSRASSVIWRHFGFKSLDVEQKEIVCKVCYAVVSAPQGNTTNMFNHLKFSYKVVYDKVLTEQKTQKSARASTSATATATQSSIEDTLSNAAPYLTGSRLQREITEAVTFMLAKDMCPISTVCNPGFKTLVKTMDKRYVLPSRKHFSRVALPALYDKCRAEVEKDISTANQQIIVFINRDFNRNQNNRDYCFSHNRPALLKLTSNSYFHLFHPFLLFFPVNCQQRVHYLSIYLSIFFL